MAANAAIHAFLVTTWKPLERNGFEWKRKASKAFFFEKKNQKTF
jgi:hypothetical protein